MYQKYDLYYVDVSSSKKPANSTGNVLEIYLFLVRQQDKSDLLMKKKYGY